MKTVQINDRWKIEIGDYNNHSPVEYREGINIKTKEATLGWQHSGKYCRNMEDALRYIIREEANAGENTVTLQEHLDLWVNVTEKLMKDMNALLKE